MKPRILPPVLVRSFLYLSALLLCWCSSLSAGNPYSAFYSAGTNNLLWFIQASDTHIGTSGTTDSTNLQWLVSTARTVINPSFFVVSGDLTDSTNGNFLGYPNGPYQSEWDQYKSILSSSGVDASFYFDLPGNHDAYNDRYFSYYLANSVQGRTTHNTQASWTRTLPLGTYHFLGINTADNTGAPFSLISPYGDHAGLDSSELSFISSEMTTHATAALTLVFGHHPLVPTGDSTDTYLFYGKDEFVSLMNTHGASLYGYGHTHVSSEQFFSQNMTNGIFYFNISSLGKDSPNQYAVTAIDCNGISSVTQTVGTWPVVLITAPMNRRLGGLVNPYAYTVPNGTSNPIRALIFDPTSVTQVQFRVNGGTWQPMTVVSGNSRLWQGIWNASTLTEGEYTLEVQATTGSGVRSDTVAADVKSQVLFNIGVSDPLIIGKYVTIAKTKTTTFSPTASFRQGETVVIRGTVQNAFGIPMANATVGLVVTGPSNVNLASALSNSNGLAEAKWTTTAPNKRGQGGTPAGTYTATVTGVSASGYQWDRLGKSITFTISK